MSRIKIYDILKTICKTDMTQQLKGHIKDDTLVLKQSSVLTSMNNDLAGWDVWIIYIYTPNSPTRIDELKKKIIKTLIQNDIEVIHELKQEYYDEKLHCYVSTISCRTPSIYLWEE